MRSLSGLVPSGLQHQLDQKQLDPRGPARHPQTTDESAKPIVTWVQTNDPWAFSRVAAFILVMLQELFELSWQESETEPTEPTEPASWKNMRAQWWTKALKEQSNAAADNGRDVFLFVYLFHNDPHYFSPCEGYFLLGATQKANRLLQYSSKWVKRFTNFQQKIKNPKQLNLNTKILNSSNCYRSISTDDQIHEIILLTACSSSINRAEQQSVHESFTLTSTIKVNNK